MTYGSPKQCNKHHHHHHRQDSQQYQNWDSSNGYGEYATVVEPMRIQHPEAQQYQYAKVTFQDNYEGYVLQDPRMTPALAYHHHRRPPPPAPPLRVNSEDYMVSENVDTEAEEFIKLEHKKFLKLLSQAPR